MPLSEHQGESGPGKRLFRTRNKGLVDGRDQLNQQTEHNFRQDSSSEVVAAVSEAASPAQTSSPIRVDKPPKLVDIKDRFHKRGIVYIYVSKDHPADDDSPLAPGYAPNDKDSSILSAYEKALGLVEIEGVERCVIRIIGGTWAESIYHVSPKIDFEGEGKPKIIGTFTVAVSCTQTRIANIEFVSETTSPAFIIEQGFDMVWRSPIQLFGVHIHGPSVAFRSYRRFFAKACLFEQDQAQDITLEIATMEVFAHPADRWWSQMEECTIRCAGQSNPSFGDEFYGYAIRASSHVLNQSSDGGYLRGDLYLAGYEFWVKRNSGLLLDNCMVYGGLLCECWTVKHRHGSQTGGVQVPDRRGWTYATLRGWSIFDPMNGATEQIPALVFFDNTDTKADAVARFVRDNNQSSPYTTGGKVYFRNSLQLAHYDHAPGSAFYGDGATAYADCVQSATSAVGWYGSAVGGTITDCSTNVPLTSMLDLLII